jgi:hypothetical protein
MILHGITLLYCENFQSYSDNLIILSIQTISSDYLIILSTKTLSKDGDTDYDYVKT